MRVGDVLQYKEDNQLYKLKEIGKGYAVIDDGIRQLVVNNLNDLMLVRGYKNRRTSHIESEGDSSVGQAIYYTWWHAINDDYYLIKDKILKVIRYKNNKTSFDVFVPTKYISGKTRLEATEVVGSVSTFHLTKKEDKYLVEQIISEVGYRVSTGKMFLEDVMEEINKWQE